MYVLYGWCALQTRHPPDQAPPPQQTTTVADGTHPTGMHSCLFNDLILIYFQALWWLFLFIALAVTADDL